MTQSCLHLAKGSGLFFPQPTSSNRAQSDSGFSEQLLSCGFRTNELSAQPVDQSVTQSQNCILLDLFYTRERERTIVVNFFFFKDFITLFGTHRFSFILFAFCAILLISWFISYSCIE